MNRVTSAMKTGFVLAILPLLFGCVQNPEKVVDPQIEFQNTQIEFQYDQIEFQYTQMELQYDQIQHKAYQQVYGNPPLDMQPTPLWKQEARIAQEL